jgi:hypothetical protein
MTGAYETHSWFGIHKTPDFLWPIRFHLVFVCRTELKLLAQFKISKILRSVIFLPYKGNKH